MFTCTGTFDVQTVYLNSVTNRKVCLIAEFAKGSKNIGFYCELEASDTGNIMYNSTTFHGRLNCISDVEPHSYDIASTDLDRDAVLKISTDPAYVLHNVRVPNGTLLPETVTSMAPSPYTGTDRQNT